MAQDSGSGPFAIHYAFRVQLSRARNAPHLAFPTVQVYGAPFRDSEWKERARPRERFPSQPAAPPSRTQFRCIRSSRELRCAWQCLRLRRIECARQAPFQQQSVREELASPTNVTERLIAAPNRIRSADSPRNSSLATRWNELFEHLVHLERGIQVAKIFRDLVQPQPNTRYLGIPRKANEATPAREIDLICTRQELIRLKLSQQHPCRLRDRLNGIVAPPENGTFKNTLQHVSDEVQIVGMPSQVDAFHPAAGLKVRQTPIQVSFCGPSVTLIGNMFR